MDIRVATFDGPGAPPIIRTVPRPAVPKKAALFRVGACGVCGTDLHILAGHWPKPLPWPFTLGHEVAGVIEEIGPELTEDYMGNKLEVGAKVMIPPLMPCGFCYMCKHFPNNANKCLTPVYYGRYLGFDKAPHLWGGWAEMEYVDLDMLPGTKIYRLPGAPVAGLAPRAISGAWVSAKASAAIALTPLWRPPESWSRIHWARSRTLELTPPAGACGSGSSLDLGHPHAARPDMQGGAVGPRQEVGVDMLVDAMPRGPNSRSWASASHARPVGRAAATAPSVNPALL